jgi:competence ComEA-like helix-hairpin-helix protein
MIKEAGILVLILFLFSEVSASCNETQVDINNANMTELDSLIGIGLSKAQAIIDSRPFSSVDDLIRVNGIGNATLNNIKKQGLACVIEETQSIEENVSQEQPVENETINQTEESNNITTETSSSSPKTASDSKVSVTQNTAAENIILTPISLNAQNIKSENTNENLVKNLPFYGIISFCVLFGALFLLKKIRRQRENEFR